MEEDLGRPIAAVFSSISEHPIAAASLGQVCAGTSFQCYIIVQLALMPCLMPANQSMVQAGWEAVLLLFGAFEICDRPFLL